MSEAVAPAGRRAPALRRPLASAIVAGTASFVLFAWVARPLLAHHFLQAGVYLIAGDRWGMLGFVPLGHAIPGAGPWTAAFVTICAAAAAQAMLAHDLTRRGWPPAQATLGVLLNSANPVVLFIATSGTPTVFYALIVGVVVLALDRVEAIGDTRALIVLGLAASAMLAVWPDAAFWILAMLAVLPIALRGARSLPAALALITIVLMPSLILIAAFFLSAELFGAPADALFALWASTLHGASPEVVQKSVWLGRFGGRPIAAFFVLLGLCATAAPRLFMIAERLALRRSERERPATALAAALLPPLGGAMATLFWVLGSPIAVLACSIGAVAGWSATSRFRRSERWLWVALSAAGTIIGWLVLPLFPAAGIQAWSAMVLGT
ncbi:MAG: hypothetical protein ACREFZ_05775 [Acetobacteraceae bacterium]